MPTPGPDHRRLHRLAGTWRGTETYPPSPWAAEGGSAQATTRFRVSTGGFAVVGDYEQTRDGLTTFEGHAVYTFDARAQQVVLSWWDSLDQGREEFRGSWQGDVLTLTSEGAMGLARLVYDYSSPGKLRSSMHTSPDGKAWTLMFEGSYEQGA